jgi:multiple antibiotic resistance protein
MGIYLDAVLALFAVLNPLGNLPVFVEVSAELDPPTRRRLFNLTTATGFLTLLVLALCGEWVMKHVFDIKMAEFKIAGGILLTAIAVKNIIGSAVPHRDPAHPEDVLQVGVVPLAIPLLVGPGAITTAILILHRDGRQVTLVSIAAVFAVTWIILRGSTFIHRLLGRFGALALSRVLQIFIAAIGVKFLVSGIREVVLAAR